MKSLNGKELAEFIKQRQAHEVRALRQAHDTIPKLGIIQCGDNPVNTTYLNLKKNYSADILVDVDLYTVDQSEIPELVQKLNKDASIHGIIIQLPLTDSAQTDEILNMVAPEKDVDGLGKDAIYDPATPMAILWLLSGYNVDLNGKHILLIGRGKLVGAPLEKMLVNSDYDVEVIDRPTDDLSSHTINADIIITATGSPGLLLPDMIKEGAVVVDAGTASEGGKIVGDVHESVYERDDLTITPVKGGVGPLTVCALFDNVIRAAKKSTALL